MMIVKCGRDGLPEFLQREGATQRSAAFVLGESRSTRDVGVQDPPDRTELIHNDTEKGHKDRPCRIPCRSSLLFAVQLIA